MVYIDESRIAAYRNTIRDHKRSLQKREWRENSLKPGAPTAQLTETEIVNKQLEDNMDSFTDEPCDCGWEEGRSEADWRDHEQHCSEAK